MRTANLSLIFVLVLLGFSNCENQATGEKGVVHEDPYNGLRKRYRDDGTMLAEVTYKDSIRDGIARNFYRNGKVQLEMTYVKGLRHGDATSFYESGEIYQVTTYLENKRTGIQKKYYPGNILMAEVPFEDNKQIPGMKEYSKEGKLLTKNDRIVFRLVDKTAFENKFELEIRMSDNSPHAKFSKIIMDDRGKELFEMPLETNRGIAVDVFYIQSGYTLMEKLVYTGERQTRLGNKEVFRAYYNLAIENNKR